MIYINEIKIKERYTSYLPYNPKMKKRAKELRKSGNLTEILFWEKVKQDRFHNIDFDRQKVIGNYIVDFYVKALSLVIEIDGSSHNNKEEYDAERQFYLESIGLNVFRVDDISVKNNLSNVLKHLEKYIIENYSENAC